CRWDILQRDDANRRSGTPISLQVELNRFSEIGSVVVGNVEVKGLFCSRIIAVMINRL
ncbi:unnamed protein product, partial [Musa textilis]